MEAYEKAFKIQRDVTRQIIKIVRRSARESGSAGQSEMVRWLATYLNSLDLTDSTVARQIENAFLDVYKKQGLAPFIYLNSGLNADKRIIEFMNTMISQLPRNVVITLNNLNKGAARLANMKSITNEQAVDIILKRKDFKGLVLYDSAGRPWTLSSIIKRNIRDQTKRVTRDCAVELGAYLGTTVYQVSQHVHPRPICSMYEHKLISDDTRIYIDSEGNKHEVILTSEIESYEYGGGLFGINCRHIKFPMVGGFTRPSKFDPLVDLANKMNNVEKKYK